jgi:hypothetical protein
MCQGDGLGSCIVLMRDTLNPEWFILNPVLKKDVSHRCGEASGKGVHTVHGTRLKHGCSILMLQLLQPNRPISS